MLCGCAHEVLNHSSAAPPVAANASILRGDGICTSKTTQSARLDEASAEPIEPSSLCKRTKIQQAGKGNGTGTDNRGWHGMATGKTGIIIIINTIA